MSKMDSMLYHLCKSKVNFFLLCVYDEIQKAYCCKLLARLKKLMTSSLGLDSMIFLINSN